MINWNTLKREIEWLGDSDNLKISILPETQISLKYRYIEIEENPVFFSSDVLIFFNSLAPFYLTLIYHIDIYH
jgi:hypothetical protein